MKAKLVAIVMAVVVLLSGCGNMSMGFGSFTYEKVHVDTYHNSMCFTVDKWYDAAAGIEVLTEEVGSMFLSEGTYILLEGDESCPFCK